MRLFFALSPSQDKKQQIEQWRQQHIASLGRPVQSANYHVTLAFIGQVTPSQLPSLIALANNIDSPPIHMTLNTLQCWPKPKVLFLGCQHSDTPIYQLAEQLQQGCRQLGFDIIERQYVPHLTLCRNTAHLPDVDDKIIKTLNLSLSFFDFCLYQSVSSEQGVRYDVLHRWLLSAQQT
ncbi:RNA 2',3'-cyclic phosphodiesterase [Thalassotalea sp. Y01]|uniref:RNA 2',3'-cyclic phosphodiesterase n=1 Tax=Thalassotalea sp. Y01 TaxID=2729613 RepID=UPI00145D40D6|nr:RNA 2',3'-cyclic phosphodiesterase [Thalassotalea sp. Y01]NMP15683.1 RNA 2',3'-cyclic phosphodiesterase [Thalassotalea sp. Y01]